MKDRRTKRITLITLSILASLVVTQSIFFILQNDQAASAEKMIQSLLRQEITISNLFLVSRSLNDAHNAGLIRCIVLREKSATRPYLDLRYQDICSSGTLNLNGKHIKSEFKSLNGETWEIQFQAINGVFFVISLWLARLLGFIVVLLAGRWLFNKIDLEKIVKSQVEELTAIKVEKERINIFTQIASQVSHDIRSPLSALDMVVSDLTGLPEETRILIRSAVGRIKDIANNLLQKNREITKASPTGSLTASVQSKFSNEPRTSQLLSSLIESIVSEKRFQCQDKPGIEITSNINTDSLGLFAAIQSTEFKRLTSNLLNNAIEILGDKGKVDISLVVIGNNIELRVKDNGKGIPPEILIKIGQRGETHGKAEGSGLGLFHARTSVESWGGSLRIESEVGKGTFVIITLPKVNPPDWFVPELNLPAGGTIAVMDDDSSIKEIWRQRFQTLNNQDHQINVYYFSTPDELEVWVKSSIKATNALFLLDFEIIGNKWTGLDVAEQLDIGRRAILVSSRWEEPQVQVRCSKLEMRLIPKGLAGFVPIRVVPHTKMLDAILIDNDDLVMMTWRAAASYVQKKIECFSSPKEFFNAYSTIEKSTQIYIDSDLGNGVKGEVIAKQVFDLGFQNIYLATGYAPDSFKKMSHIKGIVGKNPPW